MWDFVKVVIIGSVVWGALNINFVKHAVCTDVSSQPTINYADLSDLIIACNNQKGVILDFRDKSQYKSAHIPHATNINISLFDSNDYKQKLRELNSASQIIIYGNSSKLATAQKIAIILMQNTTALVKVYPDGFEQWKNCKLPLEKSNE